MPRFVVPCQLFPPFGPPLRLQSEALHPQRHRAQPNRLDGFGWQPQARRVQPIGAIDHAAGDDADKDKFPPETPSGQTRR